MNPVDKALLPGVRTFLLHPAEGSAVAKPARLDSFVRGGSSPADLTSSRPAMLTGRPTASLPQAPTAPPASPASSTVAASGADSATSLASSPSRGDAGSASTSSTAGRILTSSTYRYGTEEHELVVDPRNLGFAQKLFNLDAGFVDLVKADAGAGYSVIYHSEGKSVAIDAYRAAVSTTALAEAPTDKKHVASTFSVYKVQNANFDPTGVCPDEQFTRLNDTTLFGTVDASPHLLVPQQANDALKGWLTDNGYVTSKTLPLGDLTQEKGLKSFFGLDDQTPVNVYDLKGGSFIDHVKVYYDLFKASPEYRAEQVGNMMGSVGNSLLLGVITPVLWSEGTTYGIAATMASLDNIVSPSLGILGGGVFGGVVSAAVNSDHPLDNLKKIELGVGIANTVSTGSILALHPAILKLISAKHPAIAAVSLYAAQDVVNAFAGDAASRSSLAIENEIINKNPPPGKNYSKNFFQIQGVEASLSRALSVGTYAASVAAAAAVPGLALPFAIGGAGISILGGYVFPLYHDKPEVKVTVEGRGFVLEGDHCVFDSGWDISAKGGDIRIVKEDAHHYSLAVQEGALQVKNAGGTQALEVSHDRHLVDYLPTFLKPRSMGVKEEWDLSNGTSDLVVARYGNKGYHVSAVSDQEVLISR